MAFPDEDERDARNTATEAAKALAVAPLDEQLSTNDELIDALTKQVEVLSNRLQPVSSVEPEREPGEDAPGYRGNSAYAERVGKQTYRLRNLSDKLSSVTRRLEI